MHRMTAGRMAAFAETADAVIAVWQPGQHRGGQLVDEPGALVWSELSSSDLPKSKLCGHGCGLTARVAK